MNKNINLEDVHQALSNVKHPAINCSLIELGMIKDITLTGNNVTLALLLPFKEIPNSVKNYLLNSLRQSISGIGLNTHVKTAIMNSQERLRFLAMEEKNWKGV